jgi:hypothetical protein
VAAEAEVVAVVEDTVVAAADAVEIAAVVVVAAVVVDAIAETATKPDSTAHLTQCESQ